MARTRGSTEQRGLGSDHQADRKRLLAMLQDGEPCWRCGQPMYRSQPLDRDHIIDRALGGAQGPAVLSHRYCNRSAGAKLGNQLQPRTISGAGYDTICSACGKTYSRAARSCEICGAHYHPNHGEQRSCSRTCGAQLIKRNRMAKGWIPKAQRPKPPRKAGPVASGQREPAKGWPRSAVAYFTCRYCGQTGVTRAQGNAREVCTARACQLARLQANNLRVRKGISQEEADARVRAAVTASDGSDGRRNSARDW